ncbi:ATP-binding protein [bacterium]|nr:ATP-binding protein [bacterium]
MTEVEIGRESLVSEVRSRLRRFPVVAILGARQVGKTVLSRMVESRLDGGECTRFDLERPADIRALEDPFLALERLGGLVVLDEIQRRPDLFPALRVLADRPGRPASFLVLGSASRDLIQQSSETLAGRISYLHLGGFGLEEVGADSMPGLWLRGGFPLSFLAASDADSLSWRDEFVSTFLEKDIPQLGFIAQAPRLRRLWTMLAHDHGQTLNSSRLGGALGTTDKTVRSIVDILEQTFMVRILRPWFTNTRKRVVKSPKVYIRDAGILHSLLRIRDHKDLLSHPVAGMSWEGFAMEEIIRRWRFSPRDCHFYKTSQGAELDLFVVEGQQRRGFEFKMAENPTVTKSMRIVMADLGLESLWVVHPGAKSFDLDESIRAVSLARLDDEWLEDDRTATNRTCPHCDTISDMLTGYGQGLVSEEGDLPAITKSTLWCPSCMRKFPHRGPW